MNKLSSFEKKILFASVLMLAGIAVGFQPGEKENINLGSCKRHGTKSCVVIRIPGGPMKIMKGDFNP
ncbi:hypothetical protein D3C87_793260 [compost metagenome]